MGVYLKKRHEMRYIVKQQYGRYEIRDTLLEHVSCISYTSENADIVCYALNKVWAEDRTVKEK